jgi:hypothetical protein
MGGEKYSSMRAAKEASGHWYTKPSMHKGHILQMNLGSCTYDVSMAQGMAHFTLVPWVIICLKLLGFNSQHLFGAHNFRFPIGCRIPVLILLFPSLC